MQILLNATGQDALGSARSPPVKHHTACFLPGIGSWFEGSLDRSPEPQVKRNGRVSWWPRLLLFATPTRRNSTPSRLDDQPVSIQFCYFLYAPRKHLPMLSHIIMSRIPIDA